MAVFIPMNLIGTPLFGLIGVSVIWTAIDAARADACDRDQKSAYLEAPSAVNRPSMSAMA
jgi:hypothetical protein